MEFWLKQLAALQARAAERVVVRGGICFRRLRGPVLLRGVVLGVFPLGTRLRHVRLVRRDDGRLRDRRPDTRGWPPSGDGRLDLRGRRRRYHRGGAGCSTAIGTGCGRSHGRITHKAATTAPAMATRKKYNAPLPDFGG